MIFATIWKWLPRFYRSLSWRGCSLRLPRLGVLLSSLTVFLSTSCACNTCCITDGWWWTFASSFYPSTRELLLRTPHLFVADLQSNILKLQVNFIGVVLLMDHGQTRCLLPNLLGLCSFSFSSIKLGLCWVCVVVGLAGGLVLHTGARISLFVLWFKLFRFLW